MCGSSGSPPSRRAINLDRSWRPVGHALVTARGQIRVAAETAAVSAATHSGHPGRLTVVSHAGHPTPASCSPASRPVIVRRAGLRRIDTRVATRPQLSRRNAYISPSAGASAISSPTTYAPKCCTTRRPPSCGRRRLRSLATAEFEAGAGGADGLDGAPHLIGELPRGVRRQRRAKPVLVIQLDETPTTATEVAQAVFSHRLADRCRRATELAGDLFVIAAIPAAALPATPGRPAALDGVCVCGLRLARKRARLDPSERVGVAARYLPLRFSTCPMPPSRGGYLGGEMGVTDGLWRSATVTSGHTKIASDLA